LGGYNQHIATLKIANVVFAETLGSCQHCDLYPSAEISRTISLLLPRFVIHLCLCSSLLFSTDYVFSTSYLLHSVYSQPLTVLKYVISADFIFVAFFNYPRCRSRN
jgi:hypothetical protein